MEIANIFKEKLLIYIEQINILRSEDFANKEGGY